jgi:plasmid stabilization system protein ParE
MKKRASKVRSGDEAFEVLWDLKALDAVKKIYDHILEKSFQGAETVREEIFNTAESLKINPERFPADPDLKNPYRRCLVWNYRIIFRIYPENKQVLIIHVWNSKRSAESLFNEVKPFQDQSAK